MKTAFKGDDFVRAVSMHDVVFAGEFYCALVGFGARIGKEHLVEAAVIDQSFCQFEAWAIVEGRAWRQQQLCLRGKRLCDDGRRVAEAIDRPALHEVEIALAAIIPQKRTFAPDEDGRRTCGDISQ